jgi:hypothetical protein
MTIHLTSRAVALLAASALSLLSAGSANAACAQWNVSGSFNVNQGNGPRVLMQLQQNGSNFSGIAIYNSVNGTVSGTMVGQRFNATVNWSNGDRGVYTAVVVETANGGQVYDGRTYNAVHPANWSVWSAGSHLGCVLTPTIRNIMRRGW